MVETSRREIEETLLTAICRRPGMVLAQLELMHFSEHEFSHTNRHRTIFRTILKLFKKGIHPTENDILELMLSPGSSARGEKRLSKTVTTIFDPEYKPELGPNAEQVKELLVQLRDASLRVAARKQLQVMLDDTRKSADGLYRRQLLNDIGKLGHLLVQRHRSPLDEQLEAMKQQSVKSTRDRLGIIGLDSGFPLLSSYLGGVQNELYFIGGSAGIGKSTFITQLAWQLAGKNHGTRILFLSLDHKSLDIVAKLVSLEGEIPVSYVKSPAVTNIPDEKKRRQGIERVAQMRNWLEILDESAGAFSLEDVMELVAGIRLDHTGPLVVIVDPLTKIETAPDSDLNERLLRLVTSLKTLTASHRISVIATFELAASAEGIRPSRYDLPPCPAFLEHSYATMMLYCDYINNYETPFIEWEWDSDDLMVPITELNIVKNKMGEFRGRIFYRYYNSLACFRECVQVENENYQAMIDNINSYNKNPDRPDGAESRETKLTAD